MARCIKNVENLFGGTRRPFLIKAFSQSTWNILWEVSSSDGLNTTNESLDTLNVISKILNSESLQVAVITIADEAHSDFEPIATLYNILDNLLERGLGSFYPATHGACAVTQKSKLQQVRTFFLRRCSFLFIYNRLFGRLGFTILLNLFGFVVFL